MIANTKLNLLVIHNNIKDIYSQNYLDEFCLTTNRGYFGENLFDRLMVATVDYNVILSLVMNKNPYISIFCVLGITNATNLKKCE